MKLSNYDFVEAGKWKLKGNLKSGITFELYSFKEERVIYAFVVNNEVKYIGICDNNATTLTDRMRRYKGLQGGSTNKRIAKEIKKYLTQRKTVKIFVLKPKLSYQYKSLDVDFVKGLENPLINELKPDWNIKK